MCDKPSPRVLCITDYYLPGFQAGGPIRTLANMVALLAGDLDFDILTRDRDLGSGGAFPNVSANRWQNVGKASVYYAEPKSFGIIAFRRAMVGRDVDVVYLNSFFGFCSSISIYLYERFFGGARASLLLAPRGEFSEGALAIKRWKKRSYIALAKLLGFYRDVSWHASTASEAEDIVRLFPWAKNRIFLAVDPVSAECPDSAAISSPSKVSGDLKIAFISRISPKKNLDGLLRILSEVERRIELSIYGPIEDSAYWRRCQALIEALPPTIKVEHCGVLSPDGVSPTFAEHDLFAFPTHGENFGHVIFEALRAGTPVLISDQTPWRDDPSRAITVAPLASFDTWRNEIELAADRDADQQASVRAAALEFARRYAASDATLADNLGMFLEVAGQRDKKGS